MHRGTIYSIGKYDRRKPEDKYRLKQDLLIIKGLDEEHNESNLNSSGRLDYLIDWTDTDFNRVDRVGDFIIIKIVGNSNIQLTYFDNGFEISQTRTSFSHPVIRYDDLYKFINSNHSFL